MILMLALRVNSRSCDEKDRTVIRLLNLHCTPHDCNWMHIASNVIYYGYKIRKPVIDINVFIRKNNIKVCSISYAWILSLFLARCIRCPGFDIHVFIRRSNIKLCTTSYAWMLALFLACISCPGFYINLFIRRSIIKLCATSYASIQLVALFLVVRDLTPGRPFETFTNHIEQFHLSQDA